VIHYCVFICLFQQYLETYKIYGNYTPHSNITNIIQAKNIKVSDTPDLLIIYKESFVFVDYLCKSDLTCKWLFIVPETPEQGRKIYQNIKSYGDHYYDNNVIIIKNFKPNYKELYRRDVLDFSNTTNDLDEMLELNILENKLQTTIIHDSEDLAIIKSLAALSQYLYIGKISPEKTILKCQMLAKMNFNIIEISDYGYFVKKDCINEFWIWKLSNYKIVEEYLKINQNFLNTTV
jgi:hypothetical protein